MTTNGFTCEQDVEIIEQRLVYQGFSRLDVVRLKHRLRWHGRCDST